MGFFANEEMHRQAVFSEDKRYRYSLRIWRGFGVPILPIIMLNPSIANEVEDDPTITRCLSFATDNDYQGILVKNLHALVSSDPAALAKHPDPGGPDNTRHLVELIRFSQETQTPILCAWGNHKLNTSTDFAFPMFARQKQASLVCLGINKNGSPKHPLYVKSGTPFQEFDPWASSTPI